MKKLATLLVTLLISFSSFAQTGINYKAVIKDALGNVVANDIINVKFSIIENTGSTVVYAEDHTNVMTDANGIIVLNIGEGIPTTNTFASIAWGSASHSLKTEIDIEQDATFEFMTTTQFKTVPYALNSSDNVWKKNGDDIANTNSGKIGFGVANPRAKFHFAAEEWFLFGNDTIGSGTKILYIPAKKAFRIGTVQYGATSNYWDNVPYLFDPSIDNVGFYSLATGLNTRAQGYGATAMGGNTEAKNNYAFASGFNGDADGLYSTAMGYNTDAFGTGSTALGYSTDALGNYSTAMGNNTTAQAYASTAIGRYNVGSGSATSWLASDPVFEIGIGASSGSPANAMTVLKNGNVGIGTTSPYSPLHVVGDLRIGSQETITDGGTFRLDFNATLRPSTDSGKSLGDSEKRWSTVYATNGVINTSDRRDKENINDLSYGLNEVMRLRPVSYTWKDKRLSNGKPKLGLIAQEVQAIMNEVVQDKQWIEEEGSTEKREVEAERMGIYYSDIIPVLIKAIQEQQEIIDSQNSKIDSQNSKINTFESSITELTKRMTALEAINNN